MNRLRIATYNIHKCVGLDRRFSPERIVEVLKEIDADVIALQEVLCHSRPNRRDHQAEFIAGKLGMDFRLGENRQIRGGDYGNATLTRFNIAASENYDITVKKYEARGCLWTNIDAGASQLQFFNVHMGTSFFERRKQVQRLLDEHIFDVHRTARNRVDHLIKGAQDIVAAGAHGCGLYGVARFGARATGNPTAKPPNSVQSPVWRHCG